MLYYEIVRLDTNNPGDRESFETVKKLVKRGWTRKAIEFLSEWDYGGENIDTARALHQMRDTVLDEPSDNVVNYDGHYHLCTACDPSGLYEAYYLVAEISALALATMYSETSNNNL